MSYRQHPQACKGLMAGLIEAEIPSNIGCKALRRSARETDALVRQQRCRRPGRILCHSSQPRRREDNDMDSESRVSKNTSKSTSGDTRQEVGGGTLCMWKTSAVACISLEKWCRMLSILPRIWRCICASAPAAMPEKLDSRSHAAAALFSFLQAAHVQCCPKAFPAQAWARAPGREARLGRSHRCP